MRTARQKGVLRLRLWIKVESISENQDTVADAFEEVLDSERFEERMISDLKSKRKEETEFI